MILGVDVLPEYRRIGLASEMMECYKNRERQNGRKRLILTCLESKVAMYQKMGYEDNGMSVSSWGGEQWHEMTCELEKGIPEQLQRQPWSLDKEKEYAYIRSSQKI